MFEIMYGVKEPNERTTKVVFWVTVSLQEKLFLEDSVIVIDKSKLWIWGNF